MEIKSNFRIVIPHDKRPEILNELSQIGVDRMTLFPDMDGIASHLHRAYEKWDYPEGVCDAINWESSREEEE